MKSRIMILMFVQRVSDAVDERVQEDGLAQSHKDMLQSFLEYRDRHDTGIPLERVANELWGA